MPSPSLQATLTEGSVVQQLRNMAAPMVIGLIAMMSFNAVDTFFVGQLSADALAAMSFTFPVVMVYSSIAIGLGAGTSSSVARAIGSGNRDLAKRLITDAMTLSFIISAILALAGWVFSTELFTLLGASPELLPLVDEYMSIWYLGVPALTVPMVAMAALRAMGLSKMQGSIMGVSAILNAVLDPILIFGLLGAPRLELAGAAWASLIIRLGVMLVVFYILMIRMKVVANPIAQFKELKTSWGEIFKVALPAMGTNVIIPMSSAIVVSLVAGFGKDAVAGLGVALRIEPMVLICFYALSAVVGPFFGQNISAKKYDRAHLALSAGVKFCLLSGLLVAGLLALTGPWLASLFSDSPQVVEVASMYLWMVPISYGCYGMVMFANAAFNGLGRPLPALLISTMRVLGLFLPLAWVAMSFWGIYGLFLAASLANVLLGVWAYFWLRRAINQLNA